MRSRVDLIIKAAFTLLVGAALFLLGCYPRPAVEISPEKEAFQKLSDLAEMDVQAGNYERAIERYELFLKEHPVGEESRKALYGIAKINYDRHLYDKALPLFERIAREYPAHPGLPVVEYDIADTYYRLGAYEKSKDAASEWLKRYPTHPLKGEVLLLGGKSCKALGSNPEAFYWWLKASKASYDSPGLMSEIADRITGLTKDSSIEELKEMTEYAVGSDYVPHVYYQMASMYLEGNQLDNAKSAAMALIRSTPEQSWVSLGRHILESIEEELSVKKGVIGCLLPLSGPFAIYGQEVLNGIELGMGIWNESKDKQSLELVIKDTGGETEDAILGVEQLAKEEKVIAIIGPLASKPALDAAKRAQELGVPIVTLTQKEDITAEGEMVFRNFLPPSKEMKFLLEKAVYELGLKRFAILYPDNAYGHYVMNLVWDKVDELGGMIKAVESYRPEQTDFAVEIERMVGLYYPRPQWVELSLMQRRSMEWENVIEDTQLSEEEPEPIVDFDAVIIPDTPQQIALIAPQFPFHNIFDVRLFGTSLWQSPELIEMAGDYVQGAIFPSGFFAASESNGVAEFVRFYRGSFGSEPGVLAANGYDTIRFLKTVMNDGAIRTRRDLQYTLVHHDSFSGVTGKISFDEQGEVEKAPILLTVSGKRFHVASTTP